MAERASPDAVFRFNCGELELEFAGPEAWVAGQISHFLGRIKKELGLEDAAPAGTSQPPLAEFLRSARTRTGRGALQDTILVFAHYLRETHGVDEIGIDDIGACFGIVGQKQPRNLANTIGVMKRSQRFFEPGSRRGRYTLTDRGLARAKSLIGRR